MREPDLKTTTEQRPPANHTGVKEGNGRPASTHEAIVVEKKKPSPSGAKLAFIAIAILVLIGVMFAVGYLPRVRRVRALDRAVSDLQASVPEVNVVQVKITPPHSDLLLPGNITPITEAIINARADGYLKSRYVDFGDRVKAGQLLAEIEAPELDQQVSQARAAVEQGQSNLSRSQHLLAQSDANLHLAEVTVQRWKTLVDRGVVSKQEYDQQNANF